MIKEVSKRTTKSPSKVAKKTHVSTIKKTSSLGAAKKDSPLETAKKAPELEAVSIKKVGIISVANLFGVLHVIWGLIVGIIIALSSILASSIIPDIGSFGFVVGPLAIVILPIGMGIAGWINGFIIGILYNLSARLTKGLVLYA